MQRKIHITYNAPVTLTFILICGAVTLLGYLTGGRSTASLFAVYGLQLNDPLTYLRLFMDMRICLIFSIMPCIC